MISFVKGKTDFKITEIQLMSDQLKNIKHTVKISPVVLKPKIQVRTMAQRLFFTMKGLKDIRNHYLPPLWFMVD